MVTGQNRLFAKEALSVISVADLGFLVGAGNDAYSGCKPHNFHGLFTPSESESKKIKECITNIEEIFAFAYVIVRCEYTFKCFKNLHKVFSVGRGRYAGGDPLGSATEFHNYQTWEKPAKYCEIVVL